MAKILWLDCSSGAAGDMLSAALIGAGGDRSALDRALASLPVEGFSVCVSEVERAGVACTDFDVVLDAAHATHDHDMDYLFGHLDDEDDRGHGHGHDHHHEHDEHWHGHDHHHELELEHEPHHLGHEHHEHENHEYEHHHEHGHEHHTHVPHEHRRLGDILPIVEAMDATEGAKALARRIFAIIADAEAKAHGTTPEEVVFHEVGAVDSIVDVISAAVLFDSLAVSRVHLSRLCEGHGRIRTSHGVLSIPVPAVLNVCEAHRLPLALTDREGELITPTGAAILAAIVTDFGAPAGIMAEASGYGAGKRDYPWANFVRAVVGEAPDEGAPIKDALDEGASDESVLDEDEQGERALIEGAPVPTDVICKLECEVDDMTGEAMGAVIDSLMAAGAREAHWIALGTKKSRPAWQLQVLCDPGDRDRLELRIFRDTTTIGIRHETMGRTRLAREEVDGHLTLDGQEVPIRLKVVTLPDGSRRAMPEADDVRRIADESGLSYQAVWQEALGLAATLVRQ